MSFYDKNTSDFTEIGIAVAKYNYGKKAKITIPALLPLVPADKVYRETDENDDDKLINKDPSDLDLGKVTECNYVELLIPKYLCPKCSGMELEIEKNLKVEVQPSNCGCPDSGSHDHEVKVSFKNCKHEGKAGDKFLVTFVGGNINNPIVYRRYDA